MKIGNLNIDGFAALAPMAGVADRAFRELCVSYGAAYTVTEMVSSKALTMQDKKSRELLEISDTERPCAAQLFGDNPEIMAQAAVKALEFKPQFIDINMGCPAPKIAGNGGGSAQSGVPVTNVCVNCLFAGNYQSAWCDVKYKYQDDNNDDVPHLTNCVYTTSDNLTGHDQYMKDCKKVAASRVRFLGDPERPFALQHRSAVRNFGLTEPWLLALVGEKDVYGQPRLYEGRIDAGAAECNEEAPGALLLLR